ncbi:unannotated protein [freshwater metagenome]|uniref:Transcriptional regulator MraZ n=1 Tax=freshwater metagenome TaxID=449393 RepID=A0A6J7CIF6_9ZZZZ
MSFMFLGQHFPRLDDKGRMILPAKFRDALAPGVVLTKGQEGCLYIYPQERFNAMTEELSKLPVTSKNARDYNRVLFSGASDEIPDKQGRITVPSQLRDYAHLTKELVVIGNNTHLEIWDLTTWNEYLTQKEPAFSQISEGVLPPT